ncbi:MAG TPA: 16S rRNA (guanine(527)-N(7))-methyltransferase RsmG [Kofleriaceae bacterium]
MTASARLRRVLETLSLPADTVPALVAFATLFRRWNKSINLSAARSEDAIVEHIVDSLHVVPLLRDAAITRILDVGAGGGMPAVVAAICLPGAHITALEPVHKKHAFLRTAARELGLTGLEPLALRVDDHPVRDYDAAMSRATFDLRDWLFTALDRVRPGGLALGFEAIQRDDLPPGVSRYPYALADKTRAVVAIRRPA